MAKLQELKKYLNYEFSSGTEPGKDYRTFQTKYINYLRDYIAKPNNWTIVNVGKNHYEFTLFFKDEKNKYIYFSISDVRYCKNEWYSHILIRTATNELDYTGGNNYFTNLDNLVHDLQYLFKIQH